MGNLLIPCQNCFQQFPPSFMWYVCNECGFRICPSCLAKHKGRYSNGGNKCSQCQTGILRMKR